MRVRMAELLERQGCLDRLHDPGFTRAIAKRLRAKGYVRRRDGRGPYWTNERTDVAQTDAEKIDKMLEGV